MSLKGIAKETLQIVEVGGYTGPSGQDVDFGAQQDYAAAGTVLYRPENLRSLLKLCSTGSPPAISVTEERTQEAAKRLEADGLDVALLNFASARKQGGGFINGAKAQEEDLCRCSGLYECLGVPAVRDYYTANNSNRSTIYTDHIIYSPGVPFFRTKRDLLDNWFEASVITAPAPNCGQSRKRNIPAEEIEEALRRRAGMVLGVARDNGHRNLVLGAWGCGVFGNPPATVADAFGSWLEGPVFTGAFDRVVFAVYNRSARERENFEAFRARFG